MTTAGASRRRWGMAAAGALAGLAGLAVLFHAPRNPPVEAPAPAGSAAPLAIKLVSLSKNEAALTDPTPLFLPTEWNAGQNALPANARREPGSAFLGYPAKLKFAETELSLDLPAQVALPARPVDTLESTRPGQTFLGLDRSIQPISQLPKRRAFIEIVAAADGRRIMAQPVTGISVPGGGSWQPMEFLVAIDAMGLVGPPLLTESSRVAAIDGYFQGYLETTLHVGERLVPGFYRISIGP